MTPPERDEEAVSQFVETFAALLSDAGWQRMSARVFMALMTHDSGAMTASELAERLQVSPAAVSGAVRYLGRLDLVTRERQPGTRRDIYRVRNDAWHDAVMGRDPVLTQWEARLSEAADLLGPETPAGRRFTESVEFFMFLQQELGGMMERWRAHRDELRAKYDPR
ncbi:GbsR/MarR family transcriptional regulator [Actinomadura vinacea]